MASKNHSEGDSLDRDDYAQRVDEHGKDLVDLKKD